MSGRPQKHQLDIEQYPIGRKSLYISFILSYLSRQIAQCRHFPCAVRVEAIDIAPRVDGQASAERTGIGGWLPDVGDDGRPRTRTSLWFSHGITQDEIPWIYDRSGKPSLMISSLEALAVIVALKIFFPSGSSDSRRKVDFIPTWTDNSRLVLYSWNSLHMKEEGIKANVRRAPRQTNCEADRLANGNFDGFSSEYRILIDFSSMRWYLLDEALSMERDAELAYEFAKHQALSAEQQDVRSASERMKD